MTYDEMSDLLIDRKIFALKFGDGDKDMERIWKEGKFRPTKNPNSAWPIIAENGISIEFDDNAIFQNAYICNYEGYPEFEHGFDTDDCRKSPLRAAMICFLKMKDAEKE